MLTARMLLAYRSSNAFEKPCSTLILAGTPCHTTSAEQKLIGSVFQIESLILRRDKIKRRLSLPRQSEAEAVLLNRRLVYCKTLFQRTGKAMSQSACLACFVKMVKTDAGRTDYRSSVDSRI